MSSSLTVPVSLAEISRLAGVGRAAVSNWRRRHPTFPARIGGTDVNPQFSMTEIEAWLRANGKIKKSTEREWLWPRFDALGGRDAVGTALAEAGRRLAGRAAAGNELAGETRALVDQAVKLGLREGGSDTFEFLLRRWLDVHVRQIATTPQPLARLMAELALRTSLCALDGTSGITAVDPACGTGHLLAAAAHEGAGSLLGGELDPVLADLAEARLRLGSDGATDDGPIIDVRAGDSLRDDPFTDTSADIALCNPPFNERDWGYEELATDTRWSHGLPPRTEPELAWVQHCLARLRPGGAAVLLLPPAVAARRAGRRIRGSLLRTGALRAIVALPPGCAAPHSVSLHLWVLRAPGVGEESQAGGRLLVVDAASRFPRTTARDTTPDWAAIGSFVREAFDEVRSPDEDTAPDSPFVRQMPVIELLDDEVDLTPGRHITPSPRDPAPRLAASWKEFTGLTTGVGKSARLLAALDLTAAAADTPTATTVAELARAGALTLRGGQQPPEGTVREGTSPDDGIPLLTVPDLLMGGEPRGCLAPEHLATFEAVVAEPGDIVVVGAARKFSAWVHEGPPIVLGPQLFIVRVQPEQLDAWFVAGSLRAPANARQAGTHATSSSRIDVRRLQVRQVPLSEQRRYGKAFQELAAFERMVRRAADLGADLVRDLGDELASGRLTGGA
ncbi:N-6 DNA methylase [Actinacidiphila sp. bgisy167]|uniref:HsdM family class I SAM-dependent methyltransferase n=1 Tax=Actinacidiphila sp. bgisy167 TaxID=3413797 RepID=UPI003D75398F